ncbi:MAG: DEDD exonuclease domain-containing protein [Acidimicrobiia bacterium]
MVAGIQPSFEALGTPLADVTFVVVDLETTGASPATAGITEIGAVKVRGGECLGTFETLVNPGLPIPPMITVLTGITEAMLIPAPTPNEVIPAFLEFSRGAVIVGHNVRFDISFLDAACRALGHEPLPNERVDTLALARRLVRDEVPNLKLGTLARALRVPTSPSHRAMADARATVEVFHALLERAGTLGVTGLDDLMKLPKAAGHPQFGKLKLTADLPRSPGMYSFVDDTGRILYVGKATDLRSRVRSYFSSDDRRKIPQLLRETARIDHLVCDNPLEAEVREIRAIQQHEPRFNRRAKAWRRYAYLKLSTERFPRLTVVREAKDDGAVYLGPFNSSGGAHHVREAIESAVPLRRCSKRVGKKATLDGPLCLAAQLGASSCPCSGATSESDYADIVAVTVDGLTRNPARLLEPLEARMHACANDERFEEAALARDRLQVLARALDRQRRLDRLRLPARLELARGDNRIVLERGRVAVDGLEPAPPADGPACPRNAVDELLAVARWLDANATTIRLIDVSGTFASPVRPVPRYELRPRAVARTT